jgi:TDG/mug DNA glycosylase family protein
MIKYPMSYGLRILFIGINPHPGSSRRGVPFSNNKMFWYLLQAAGLLQESREELKNDKLLKQLYAQIRQKYQFGFLNVVDRPTRTASELTKEELVKGTKRLIARIKKYRPLVVCFVGKVTYRSVKPVPVSYGWQEPIGASHVYVMHAPHHGPAAVRVEDLKEIMRVVKKLIK